jgi:Tol biopolymer transport system component
MRTQAKTLLVLIILVTCAAACSVAATPSEPPAAGTCSPPQPGPQVSGSALVPSAAAATPAAHVGATSGRASASETAAAQSPGEQAGGADSSTGTSGMIAFLSREGGQTDVWWISDIGAHAERLTNDSSIERGLTWSPDGAMLSYVSKPAPSASDHESIWCLSPRDHSRRLVRRELSTVSEPTWSPGGDAIAFSSWTGNVPHLWTVRLLSGEFSEISQQFAEPLWSPAAAELMVVGAPLGAPPGLQPPVLLLWVVDTSGVPIAYLGAEPSYVPQITGRVWSHQGDRILVTSQGSEFYDTAAALEVLVVKDGILDVDAERRMTCLDHPCDFFSPSWFPSGREVLFIAAVPMPVVLAGESPEPDQPRRTWWLYRASSDLTTVEPVLESDSPISEAALSPDGKQVAFVLGEGTDTEGQYAEIVVLDLETRQTRQLTHNSVWDGAPAWQPLP